MRVDWSGAIKDKELATIKIGGEEFAGIGYQGLMTVNTKTYIEEPTRANDGSIPNIDDHETFIVPRCKVNFKFFNIGDYQRLCRVLNSANQFSVEYFDKQFGERRTYMMYAEPEEMAKIYNVSTSVIGLLDYEVSFVGTLNELQKYKVLFVSKYFDGSAVVDLQTRVINFSDTDTYTKGQKVYWGGNYYEAIFYNETFKGKPTDNSEYWVNKTAREWNVEETYVLGDLVYVKEEGKEDIKYYEAKTDSFKGHLPTNKDFWTEIQVKEYSAEKTYKKGDIVYVLVDGEKQLFQAIFYDDTFTGKHPEDAQYWNKILQSINVEKEVPWGSSIKVLSGADISDFYNIPTGKVFKEWNTRADGLGFKMLPNANWTVFENTTAYPIFE